MPWKKYVIIYRILSLLHVNLGHVAYYILVRGCSIFLYWEHFCLPICHERFSILPKNNDNIHMPKLIFTLLWKTFSCVYACCEEIFHIMIFYQLNSILLINTAFLYWFCYMVSNNVLICCMWLCGRAMQVTYGHVNSFALELELK